MARCGGKLKPINTRRANSETEEEPLSPMSRLFHTPALNCIIIAVFGFKKRLDVEAFKHGLENSMVKHPRFCSKLVFDGKEPTKPLGWVRTMVNVDDHVIVPILDPCINSPDQLVDDYISNLSKSTMDLSKPLWDFHVLNVETSEATSFGVFRFHHSLGDGVSLISTLLTCTRKTSDPSALPSLPITKNKLGRGNYHGFLRYFYALLWVFKLSWNTFVDVLMMIATMIYLKDTKTPLKGAPGIEKSPKWFVHRILNFQDIKLVKNAMGMTVNDVLLGVMQAGLTRYLNGKYGQDKGENRAFKNNLPKHIRLRALVAVNLRPTIMIEDILEMMEANSKCSKGRGNLFGYVFFPFHLTLRDDPLDYIRDAKATMDRKKQTFQPWLSYFNTKFLLSMVGVKAAASSFYRVVSNTTLILSCLAGPIEEMTWSGHPVAFFAPSAYGVPQALVIHFQSYMDKMIVALAVDRNVIPDPYKLCDAIEESLVLAKNCVVDKKLLKVEHVD